MKIEPQAIVSDACVSFATLDNLNTELTPSLKAITQDTDFFAYYRLNLYNQICPFWDDSTSMCGNIACVVNTLDNEQDIPEIWRAEELSKLEGPKAAHPGKQLQQERGNQRPLQGTLGEDVGESCVVEYDDECDQRDYCVPEDERASAKGDYVSLVDNPERFTGYAGEGAHMVWDAIYGENCFPKSGSSPSSLGNSLSNKYQAANDLRSVLQANDPSSLSADDECLEKRVFHRVISGMHASISTHICHDYLNQTTGIWGPNIQCYKDRLAAYPDRISNLYFNYALVLRAVAKLRGYLENYTFCSGDPVQDHDTKSKVLHLASTVASRPAIFDESLMFQDPLAAGDLKDDFRHRFRNVSRMMDCVGCDKCRLWGKLQTVGYGTALKVLFEYDEEKKDEENPLLKRTELVALVNTLDRISSSLTALDSFTGIVAAEDTQEQSASQRKGYTNSRNPSSSDRKVRPAVTYGNIDEFGDDEDEFESPPSHQLSVMDGIREECYLVWRVYVYVIKSWLSLPQKTLNILILEMSRLWNFWLGLPVGPRSWEFHYPTRDEI